MNSKEEQGADKYFRHTSCFAGAGTVPFWRCGWFCRLPETTGKIMKEGENEWNQEVF